jgi:hypothetical protein
MAGTRPGFSGAAFRTALRSVMDMATPTGTNERVEFGFADTVTVVDPHDSTDVPFDPAATVTRTTPATVTVSCVVEPVDAAGQSTPFGTVRPSWLRITLFDEDYETVKTATHVAVRGDTYVYDNEPPAIGLFDVTVHTLMFKAVNET